MNAEMKDRKIQPGVLSNTVGIICNIALFLIKTVLAYLSGSVAVLSDAFNNLSDCLSNIISLFGYRISSRPADREHPFGHGRVEYLVSLVTEGIIFLLAYELLRESVHRIISPAPVSVSAPVLIGLIFSIIVKIGMYIFNTRLAAEDESMLLKTTAQDSRNDALTTSAALISLLLMRFTSLPLDGIFGTVIAVFIFISGCTIASQIIAGLLGRPLDADKTKEILDLIGEDPRILGIHDLIIHDYGNRNRMGSAHYELDAQMSFRDAHEVIDRAEKRVRERTGIELTLHMDPKEQQDDLMREKILTAVRSVLPQADIHDLQRHPDGSWELDVLVPFGTSADAEIKEAVTKIIRQETGTNSVTVTLDRPYTGEVQ